MAWPGLDIDLIRRQWPIAGALLSEGDFLSQDGNTATVHAGPLVTMTERPIQALAVTAGWRRTETSQTL